MPCPWPQMEPLCVANRDGGAEHVQAPCPSTASPCPPALRGELLTSLGRDLSTCPQGMPSCQFSWGTEVTVESSPGVGPGLVSYQDEKEGSLPVLCPSALQSKGFISSSSFWSWRWYLLSLSCGKQLTFGVTSDLGSSWSGECCSWV